MVAPMADHAPVIACLLDYANGVVYIGLVKTR
jgi:hypothetical protein